MTPTPTPITPQAVEAGAKAMMAHQWPSIRVDRIDSDDLTYKVFQGHAERCLTAALPLIQQERAPGPQALQIGDRLQSEASRIATWVIDHDAAAGDVPYIALHAALEIQGLIQLWTQLRSAHQERAEEARGHLEAVRQVFALFGYTVPGAEFKYEATDDAEERVRAGLAALAKLSGLLGVGE